MNLDKLFKTQKKLDDRIVIEKGLQGVDLLDKKMLALQVELGELANEWRGFKFWSEDQEPRTKIFRWFSFGQKNESERDPRSLVACFPGKVHEVDPLLEEYVDCLHFILSIANEVGRDYFYFEPDKIHLVGLTEQFQKVLKYACLITEDDYCSELLTTFVYLGEQLGFTWEQVEQAYYDKNKINHERQDEGY